jgi:hypothetical protein
MNDTITEFIQVRRINSFQKLRLLLFLHRHPELIATCQELARQLYLGDYRLMEGIIADLRLVGLVDCVESGFKLHSDPDLRSCLQCLTKAFEDPLNRQSILDQVRHRALWESYANNAQHPNRSLRHLAEAGGSEL